MRWRVEVSQRMDRSGTLKQGYKASNFEIRSQAPDENLCTCVINDRKLADKSTPVVVLGMK